MKKINALILHSSDIPLMGHAIHMQNELPHELFNVKVVVKEKFNKKTACYYLFKRISKLDKVICRIRDYIYRLKLKHFVGEQYKVNKQGKEHVFFSALNRETNAEDILNLVPGFEPDIIIVIWIRTFISPREVARLQKLTGAPILFDFVDDAHITGGCHFHIECNKYQNGCQDCSILSKGKVIPQMVMEDMLKYYLPLKKYVSGTPSDCRLAKSSPIFKGVKSFAAIPEVFIKPTDRLKAKMEFGISENEFVILVGANNVNEERKGFQYSIKCLNFLATKHDNLTLLLLGNGTDGVEEKINNTIRIIKLGFIPLDKLVKAFSASDCHLSSTVADSGPMMVNYSIASGTPVVSFNVGLAQDLVIHQKTGYIAEFRNWMQLADGCEYFYNLSISQKNTIYNNCLELVKTNNAKDKWYQLLYNEIINS